MSHVFPCAGIPTESQWVALVYILVFAAVVATFVSHTVASMILIPMVAQGKEWNNDTIQLVILSWLSVTSFTVGVHLNMPCVMVIGVAFAVSSSMAFPFSSFPNVTSALITVGVHFLSFPLLSLLFCDRTITRRPSCRHGIFCLPACR